MKYAAARRLRADPKKGRAQAPRDRHRGRGCAGSSTGRYLYREKGSPAEYGSGLAYAIEKDGCGSTKPELM
jgi:hypothetical protein